MRISIHFGLTFSPWLLASVIMVYTFFFQEHARVAKYLNTFSKAYKTISSQKHHIYKSLEPPSLFGVERNWQSKNFKPEGRGAKV